LARQVVVFDLDGTVADTIDLIVYSLNEALGDVWRSPRALEGVRPLFGPPDDVLIARELPPGVDPVPYIERYYEVYRREHARLAHTFPGMAEVLAELRRRGYALGLLTNKARRAAEITLAALGLDHLFGAVVSGSEAPPKPDPEGFLRLVATLGGEPRTAAMVGDAPGDIRVARRAGARAVAVLWGRTHAREAILAERPDFQATEPAALLSVFPAGKAAG
jgi:HAD superfamily hydrolase (TIGR01509 family)